MSGLGAPLRTATAIPDLASTVTLPADALPSFTKVSIPERRVMTTSAASPSWMRFTVAPPVANEVASLFPVARSNFGPRSSMSDCIRLPGHETGGGVPIRVENSERLFRSPLPMPCRDGQQSWTCVIPVSERSFADRSGLVEIHVTRATSGEDLRRQLDGVRRQVRINAAAIEVGGELHLQAALF